MSHTYKFFPGRTLHHSMHQSERKGKTDSNLLPPEGRHFHHRGNLPWMWDYLKVDRWEYMTLQDWCRSVCGARPMNLPWGLWQHGLWQGWHTKWMKWVRLNGDSFMFHNQKPLQMNAWMKDALKNMIMVVTQWALAVEVTDQECQTECNWMSGHKVFACKTISCSFNAVSFWTLHKKFANDRLILFCIIHILETGYSYHN